MPESGQSETQSASSQTADVAETVQANANAAEATLITGATETAPGVVEVETILVNPDPEGEEAAQAIAICEAAQAAGYSEVAVTLQDGTTVVGAGGTYGDECTWASEGGDAQS